MPSIHPTLLGICIAAIATLGVSNGAGAAIVTSADYRVDVEASVHWTNNSNPPTYTGELNAGFTISGTLPKVTLANGRLSASTPGMSTLASVSTTFHGEYHGPGGDTTGDCSGSAASPVLGMSIREGLTPIGGGAKLIITPFSAVSLPWTCTGMGMSMDSALILPNLESEGYDQGPFDLAFDLPAEAMSMGKIIQLVDRDVAAGQCPLHNAYTVSCTMHSQGVVTLTRTRLSTGSDDPDDSTPEPLTPPATTPPGPTASDPETDLGPLVPRKGKIARDAKSASVTVGCTAACSITVQAYAGGAGVRAAARPRALATRRITLPAAGSRRVTERFGAAARRAIKRAHGVRIDVTAQPKGGGSAARGSVSLKLR